jgi:hypothetical protein
LQNIIFVTEKINPTQGKKANMSKKTDKNPTKTHPPKTPFCRFSSGNIGGGGG